jgi:glycosyltransferase involved in cell wall biosynthesis
VSNGRRDIHLAVAGQGAGRGELRALTHTLGLDGYVHFLGYVPNETLPLLYRTAQLFAMPSPEELQSIASLEAMASGRPVLAANARALPELVTTGINGYLFAAGQPEDAARGMAFLADCRAEWARMGRVSHARAVEHSLASTISKYEEIYRRACLAAAPIPPRVGEPEGLKRGPLA